MASIDEIAATLRTVAAAGMKPKNLLAAVRERHPEASKKEVVRAAFYALIENQTQAQARDQDPASKQAADLHAFAIQARAADEEPPVKRSRLRKKKAPAPKPAAEAPVF
ncbi:hypothetical protein [Methylorubrum suomiense]|uniref:Uncharacterized protein n=1 Tax=Methylorubrum suomiense TaxID=144191 RepID=A0ABQ4V082_9HYPH|nr:MULTISPECIES: hypothetical protein [Methylobacteriaceae]GJE78011.1 hypothetical protein BGCPKDLD_4622 [Methylorubrum suomiense]